jgi:fibronectin type 3 domain-containing protein
MKAIIIGLLISSGLMAQFHSVALTWEWYQGTGGIAAGFNVKRATISGGPYTTIASISTYSNTYTDRTDLVEGATYYYVVTAYGPGGESDESNPSNEVSALIPVSITQPTIYPAGCSQVSVFNKKRRMTICTGK